MYITIIETATNEIIKDMWCPKEFIDAQVPENHHYIKGAYPKDKFTYDGTTMTVKMDYVPPKKSVVNLPTSTFIIKLLNSMLDAGYYLSLHDDVIHTKNQAKKAIDAAASQACERYVSPGKFTVFEYQITADQVAQWRADGSNANALPEMLQSWLDNSNFTAAEDAAQNIEQTATLFATVVAGTRRLRLEGKKAVDDAGSDFATVAQTYIDQLSSI